MPVRAAHITAASAAALALAASALVLRAGPLNPPAGPPASTYKTLTEVEPRTAVSAANTPGDATAVFAITQPGSYYLTSNLAGVSGKCGIRVTAAGVSLDLNGFTLAGAAGATSGVLVQGIIQGLRVENGSVTGWPGSGVSAATASGGLYRNLRLYGNTAHGLEAGDGSSLESCTADTNGNNGLWAHQGSTIRACSARFNTWHGIVLGSSPTLPGEGVIADCAASFNTLDGFACREGGTITGCSACENARNGYGLAGNTLVAHCTAYKNGNAGYYYSASTSNGGGGGSSRHHYSFCEAAGNLTYGFYSGTGYLIVEHCLAHDNDTAGIYAGTRALIAHNHCEGNGTVSGANIHITSSLCRVEDNTLIGSVIGLDVDGPSNLIIRNAASGNTTNYSIAANNHVGPIVASPSSGIINGSTGGAGTGSTDPWANFSY